MTILIWDAGNGTAVGEPLRGHTGVLQSVAYSCDGQYIISGAVDKTIRIWNAKTGAAVGEPLVHMKAVWSLAYSDENHIISASADGRIRIWEAETQPALGRPLNEHPLSVISIAPSPDGNRIASGYLDNTIHVWDISPQVSTQNPASPDPDHPYLCAPPGRDGWVRDSQQGLLYWVPPTCRACLHSSSLLIIHLTSQTQSVSLDFEDFVFGDSWTKIYNNVQP